MALFEYMKDVQRFLRETKQDMITPDTIIAHVNRARREVAMRAQCIRILTPISGQIMSASVTNGGAGYTSAPTVAVSAPDFPSGTLPYPNGDQATAEATIQSGTVSAVSIVYGGYGYFQPALTFSGGGGTGAAAEPAMTYINQLNQGQEVYNFSDVDLSMFPGVSSIYMIKSVSVIFSNFRYSLECPSFSTYQTMRQYPFSFQYVPWICAQFGQGTSGSFFFYPIPSQPYQIEFDCFCLPQDMIDDQSVEAIPMPWTDAIAFYAAHLCYLDLQNFNVARGYLEIFDQYMHRYGAYARPGRRVNPYGRPHGY